MNRRALLFCAAAALAAWFGTGWIFADKKADPSGATPRVTEISGGEAVLTALQRIRRPLTGSAELSRIAALLTELPDRALPGLKDKIAAWPLSATREFALAMVSARMEAAYRSENADSASSEDDTEPAPNRYRDLAEGMATGKIYLHNGFDDIQTLGEWVQFDPPAAADAVLKMPPSHDRHNAVDIVVATLQESDPAAALEFLLQSGDRRPGNSAAAAWAKMILEDLPYGTAKDGQRDILDRLSREQQDSLFESLSYIIDDLARNSPVPRGGVTNIELIASCVLQAEEAGPGFRQFFESMGKNHPDAIGQTRLLIESWSLIGRSSRTALEILGAAEMERILTNTEDVPAALARLESQGHEKPAERCEMPVDQLLTHSGPAAIESLADAGRIGEAVALLDRLTDPVARDSAVRRILPAWMDADPAAARAAFEEIPMTALERERWERDPAFLLHPAPGR